MTKIIHVPGALLRWQVIARDGVYLSGHKTEAAAQAWAARYEAQHKECCK